MKNVLLKIRQADDDMLSEISSTIMQRYQQIHPDWELSFLVLPRNNPNACLQKLEQIADFIRRHSLETERGHPDG